MKAKNLTELTDQELLNKEKRMKNNKTINASLFGFAIGIAIYAIVKNSFSFPVALPILLTIIAIVINSNNNKALGAEIHKEIKSRNLK